LKIKWLERTVMQGVNLTLCTSQKEFDAICKYLKVPTEEWLECSARVVTFEKRELNGINCIVCIELTHENPIGIASTLVHEATHVKQNLMRFIGEDTPSKEFEAYVMENISERLFTEYARRLKN
jgi:hypothetical protein